MTALTRFFFRDAFPAPSTGAVVRWWESRRLTYNLTVGAAGLLSLATVTVLDLLPPHYGHARGTMGVPWIAIVVYGVLANLCYSAGPALDALVLRRWGREFSAVGPTLFRYGFAFAVGLTLLPIPVAAIGWVLRVLKVLI